MARRAQKPLRAPDLRTVESVIDASLDSERAGESGQHTAKRAIAILAAKDDGFVVPTGRQRQNLLVAFAKRGRVVYGRAFDIVRLTRPLDLDDLSAVEANLEVITVYEIKSTKKRLPKNFAGFFFAISAAEALVAQSLREQLTCPRFLYQPL